MRWFPLVLVSLVLTVGCSGPKMLVSEKSNAEKAAEAGNYTLATDAWKIYFSQTPIDEVAGADFATAAQVAVKRGDSDLALEWFDQARYKNYADTAMYQTLAKIYRSQNNISKELSALEYVGENFKGQSGKNNQRLFEIYNEIVLPDKALQMWAQMDGTVKNETANLERYFKLQKGMKDSVVCDSLALVLLEKEPKHIEALVWIAEKQYWLGENRYQQQMDIYERNKTNKQYKILLNELDKATVELKRSLSYFEKLWELEPGKKYASYFANIYARFGDQKKVDFYKKYLE